MCAKHAAGGAWCCCWWVFVVRVGLRRAPRAAGRRLCRRRALPRQPPGVMVEEGSGEPPPGGGAIVTPRGRAPAHKDILGRAARVSGRRCEAARHVPGRSREEHHHSLLTVLEQCRRTRSLGAARPPARPDGGKATDGTRLAQPRGSWPRTRLWGGAGRQRGSPCWVVGVSHGPRSSQRYSRLPAPTVQHAARAPGGAAGSCELRQVQPRGPDGPLSATPACPRARSGSP